MNKSDSPKYWPPLGLPVGSVRALLTLFIVAVVTTSVARGDKLDLLWTETLLIAMAHYFTSRRFVSLPPNVLKRIQQEGILDKESHPLFLPRHSIRFLIIAAFVGLGVYLYQHQRLLNDSRAISLLSMATAYVGGAMLKGISSWFGERRGRQPSSMWGDIKAIVVLLAVAIAGIPVLMSMPELLPPEAHRIALSLLLFYFGSR